MYAHPALVPPLSLLSKLLSFALIPIPLFALLFVVLRLPCFFQSLLLLPLLQRPHMTLKVLLSITRFYAIPLHSRKAHRHAAHSQLNNEYKYSVQWATVNIPRAACFADPGAFQS